MAGTRVPAAMTRTCSALPAAQGPGPAADQAAEHEGTQGQAAADAACDAGAQVLKDDGRQDGQPDDDGFHDQHRAAQLPHPPSCRS